jgi:hypothetical protein
MNRFSQAWGGCFLTDVLVGLPPTSNCSSRNTICCGSLPLWFISVDVAVYGHSWCVPCVTVSWLSSRHLPSKPGMSTAEHVVHFWVRRVIISLKNVVMKLNLTRKKIEQTYCSTHDDKRCLGVLCATRIVCGRWSCRSLWNLFISFLVQNPRVGRTH